MNYARLRKQLMTDEGFRAKPYRCTAGKLTIGYGRNIEDRGISVTEAADLLFNDIDIVEDELDRTMPWWLKLSDHRQEALVNMAFNMGVPKLRGFKKMLAALEEGHFDKAAREALDSLWARQVGERAQRIAKAIKEG